MKDWEEDPPDVLRMDTRSGNRKGPDLLLEKSLEVLQRLAAKAKSRAKMQDRFKRRID